MAKANLVNLSEKELVCLLNKGNEGAFMEIYNRYKDILATNLLRILKDPDLAEEIMQELFMTIWEKRRDMDAEQSIGGYLFRAAMNRSKNVFRQMAYDQQMRRTVWSRMQQDQVSTSQDLLEDKELRQFLDNLLDNLPPQQQKVYRLCKLEGLSYKEVGQKLSISETTVNTHIRNANRILRGAADKLSDSVSVSHLFIAFLLSSDSLF